MHRLKCPRSRMISDFGQVKMMKKLKKIVKKEIALKMKRGFDDTVSVVEVGQTGIPAEPDSPAVL
jgi:hypothetical protein